jgi:hypothetical protein
MGKRAMFNYLSTTLSNSFGFFTPTLLGVVLFTKIGVFGIWLSIAGLLLAVVYPSQSSGVFPWKEIHGNRCCLQLSSMVSWFTRS